MFLIEPNCHFSNIFCQIRGFIGFVLLNQMLVFWRSMDRIKYSVSIISHETALVKIKRSFNGVKTESTTHNGWRTNITGRWSDEDGRVGWSRELLSFHSQTLPWLYELLAVVGDNRDPLPVDSTPNNKNNPKPRRFHQNGNCLLLHHSVVYVLA